MNDRKLSRRRLFKLGTGSLLGNIPLPARPETFLNSGLTVQQQFASTLEPSREDPICTIGFMELQKKYPSLRQLKYSIGLTSCVRPDGHPTYGSVVLTENNLVFSAHQLFGNQINISFFPHSAKTTKEITLHKNSINESRYLDMAFAPVTPTWIRENGLIPLDVEPGLERFDGSSVFVGFVGAQGLLHATEGGPASYIEWSEDSDYQEIVSTVYCKMMAEGIVFHGMSGGAVVKLINNQWHFRGTIVALVTTDPHSIITPSDPITAAIALTARPNNVSPNIRAMLEKYPKCSFNKAQP